MNDRQITLLYPDIVEMRHRNNLLKETDKGLNWIKANQDKLLGRKKDIYNFAKDRRPAMTPILNRFKDIL